ncbi:hypothetical protein CBM2587_B10119 [Cupriavidus taiwanensis]|uniref:Uncharacterized protein n=1 Tax=Cupriavidus taiwanensis TaxID=164546 RepID=A0A375BX96_9BURK|nr:hypothetical protein CBM2587_B10119 [Cupriavidus taiwanensis]
MLPLPRAGEGWGEGRSFHEVKAFRYCPRPALTPGPSPASGRGEKTRSGIIASSLPNCRLCTPSPARGRGPG